MSLCHYLASFKGPLIVIAIGIGFMVIGSLPVAITIALGTKNSATIIGVGFIGFGLLLVLPGIIWCLVRRTLSLPCCTSCSTERLCTAPNPEKIPSVRYVSAKWCLCHVPSQETRT